MFSGDEGRRCSNGLSLLGVEPAAKTIRIQRPDQREPTALRDRPSFTLKQVDLHPHTKGSWRLSAHFQRLRALVFSRVTLTRHGILLEILQRSVDSPTYTGTVRDCGCLVRRRGHHCSTSYRAKREEPRFPADCQTHLLRRCHVWPRAH